MPEPELKEPQMSQEEQDIISSENLSSSDEIDNLPFKQSEEPSGEPDPTQPPSEPQSEPSPQPKLDTKPDSEPTLPEPLKKDDALYETDSKEEEPFKSKEAEEIRNQEAPKEFSKGTHAKHWNDAKTKWADKVEEKDKALHDTEKRYKKEFAALKQENDELSKQVSTLSGYESVVDFQTSKKFQTEYEAPLKEAQDELVSLMTKAGASPQGLEELKKGLGNNSYLFSAIAAIERGDEQNNIPPNPALATEMKVYVGNILDAKRKHDRAITDARSNHEKLINEKRSEMAKKTASYDEGVKTSINSYTKSVNDNKAPKFPFLVKQRAPENASSEQLEAVKKHNEAVETNLADIEKMARNEDPQERVRMIMGYMTAVYQRNIIDQLSTALQQREEYIQRITKAGTPPKKSSGSVLPSASPEFDGTLSDLAKETFRG